jgi:TatD DNase family protein
MFIDAHAHLNDNRLIAKADEIVASMANDGLSAIINAGYDRKSCEDSLTLAGKYDRVYATLGIHPHDAKYARKEDYDFFAENSANPKVVAIGEIGLDFFYNHSDRETQAKVLAEQLELADSLRLPVVFHLRDAYEQFLKIIGDNKRYLNSGGLLHCYSGSREMAEIFSRKYDFYFSFGGAITFKNADKSDIIKAVPLKRLLLETDCPYMTPEPHRGKLNYPKYVSLVAQKIASILELPIEEIGRITSENTKSLFERLA